MTDYKTLFQESHLSPIPAQLQHPTYSISPFPRTDLFLLYIRTRNINTPKLQQKLEEYIDNPFNVDHQAHRCIMYIFPSEISDQFPKAQQLQQQHWQQHALFIRGATNIHLKQAAQHKIRDIVAESLDQLAAQTIYRHYITWQAHHAHKLLDPHNYLQQYDPKLAELEYKEK